MGAIMLQGTGSDVGKSVLVAGLCRALTRRGYRVRPFKPQNMSNNAAVTPDGGEIGRAQALQAIACGVAPHIDMNPVLLKPQADRTSQLIVHGQVRGTLGSGNFRVARGQLLDTVIDSYDRLRAQCDIVVVEGAGSPAEINLRAGDIANMGFARAANVPVILVGDIDRGGVIAAVVGTRTVIDPQDAAMIRGFLINKFRGDPALFSDGMRMIAEKTGWSPIGLLPHFSDAAKLPAEDALGLAGPARQKPDAKIRIAVPILPHISNFDDLDPLDMEPDVELIRVRPGETIPANCRLVLLCGSKSTIADLAVLKNAGLDIDIRAHARRGGFVVGLCGGYQMLGKTIADPDGIEGPPAKVEGLGLLDVDTVLAGDKRLVSVRGTSFDGVDLSGYEMHVGETTGTAGNLPFSTVDGHVDGAMSPDGRIFGTYIHGLFADDRQRGAWLKRLGGHGTELNYDEQVHTVLDRLAAHMEQHLDLDCLLAIAR